MVKKKIETIIENNVSKEVIQKMVPDVEDYSSIDLTESEKKSISEITGLFQTHLKDNYDMVPDLNSRSIVPTGINVLDSILGGGILFQNRTFLSECKV